MLSIIICTLNEALYLPKLLDSLVQQENPPVFEVLVVDAGSDDNTQNIVRQYMASVPFRLHLEVPGFRGIARQRNFGAEQAQYDMLLFLDADVLLPVRFLEQAMLEIDHRQVAIAGTRIYAAERSMGFRLVYAVYSHTYLPFVRIFNPVLHGCSIFVERALHQKIGGFRSGIQFEDFQYGQDAAPFAQSVLLRNTAVRTSARRFYHTTFGSVWELVRGAVRSFRNGGQSANDFTSYDNLSGNHSQPRY